MATSFAMPSSLFAIAAAACVQAHHKLHFSSREQDALRAQTQVSII
jgi:hypothetical protein